MTERHVRPPYEPGQGVEVGRPRASERADVRLLPSTLFDELGGCSLVCARGSYKEYRCGNIPMQCLPITLGLNPVSNLSAYETALQRLDTGLPLPY